MTKLEKRTRIIFYVYQHELLKQVLNSNQAFESGDFSDWEIKVIDKIALNYDKFKTLVERFLKPTWKWTRINPLERAILLFGLFEMTHQDYPLVINEMVKITKMYIPGTTYKLINGILHNASLHYEKIKTGS